MLTVWLPAIVAAVAALATVVAATITGRSAQEAQRIQAAQAQEAQRLQANAAAKSDEGKLALSIALETRREHQVTRGRLDAHEEWREALVNEWLPDHEDRDREVEREVQKLDPTFVPPPWKPLPRLKRYVPPGEGVGG